SEPADPADDEALLERVVDMTDLAATVARRLRRHRSGETAGPLWWQLYDWLADQREWRRAARRLFAALHHHNRVPPLPPAVTEQLFGPRLHGSVSRLESFA